MVQPSPLTYLNHDTSGSDLNPPGRSLFLASDFGGEVSAGLNSSETMSVFAKIDYTFDDGVQGIGGKVGVRVYW
jgi:hypothetical protein